MGTSDPCATKGRRRKTEETTPATTGALAWTAYGPNAEPNGFDALASEWNALVRRCGSDTIFLTYEWQTTWWNYLGVGELWIVAFRTPETGRLVGIAPLYLTEVAQGMHQGKRRFTLVGCIEVSDYLDLIIERGWEDQVYRTFMAWLESPDAPQWDLLDLCNLPEVSLTYRNLPAFMEGDGRQVQVLQEDTAPQFTLPRHYEDYLQDLVDKKQRHEIRRKQRRAEREADVGFFFVGPEHCLEAEIDDFVALQRASGDDKAEFMTSEMRRFFGAVARCMLDAGYLRLCFLTLNGEKAATLFAFEYQGKYLLYNSGYDPDSYAHLSPGWVLLAYVIQYAIAIGCNTFDFMQGDEEYKYHFGSQDYKVMRVIVERTGAA